MGIILKELAKQRGDGNKLEKKPMASPFLDRRMAVMNGGVASVGIRRGGRDEKKTKARENGRMLKWVAWDVDVDTSSAKTVKLKAFLSSVVYLKFTKEGINKISDDFQLL